MSDPYAAAWAVSERDFPGDASSGEILSFAQRYAILAPSGHNGQPWHFHIAQDVLHVRADRTRALPMVDPCDREMLISCAATIHLTRTALEHFGYQPDITLLPEPGDPDLLATIRLGRRGTPPVNRALFDAILTRHSNRHPYQTRPLTDTQLTRLRDAAAAEGAWLQPVTEPATISAAAHLIATGDRLKWRDAEFRSELAERLIPNRGDRRDGMPGYAFGIPGPLARLAPAMVRHADLGRLRADADRKLALATPCLAIVGTDHDDPPAWLASGQAMSRVLLQATADGLATSFLSQAVEVETLRPRLAALVGHDGYPQLLLRVGYARRPARPSPRRSLREVLTTPAPAPRTAGVQTKAGASR
jgi:nitroreductase